MALIDGQWIALVDALGEGTVSGRKAFGLELPRIDGENGYHSKSRIWCLNVYYDLLPGRP